MLLALLASLAHAEPDAVETDGVTVEADRVVVVDGVATATGNVRLQLGSDRVSAASLSADLESKTAVVHNGRWERGDDVLDFELGGFDLATGIGRVNNGFYRGASGHTELSADEMAWFDDGRVVAEGVWATICACEGPPPLSVSTSRIELVPDESLRFGPGWVRLFDVPVVPVPGGRIPLKRQSGFLPPIVGNGQDGLRARVPLYLTLGRSADLTLTPAVRTQRSVRMLTEFRYALGNGGGGQVDAAYGYDSVLYANRGSLSVEHSWDRGPWNTVIDAETVSDTGVFRDYGDAFLDRGQPWAEQRMLLGYKQLELGYQGFRSDDDLLVSPSLALRLPRKNVGGGVLVGATAHARPALSRSGSHVGSSTLVADVQRPTWLGPFRATPRLSGGWRSNLQYPREWVGSTGMEVAMPLWRTPARGFETLEPFVDAHVTRAVARWGGERYDGLGGGLRWRRTVGGRGVFTEARVNRDPFGWSGQGLLRLQAGPVFAWAQSDWEPEAGLVLGTAGASVDNGVARLASGWVTAGESTHQLYGDAGWTLPGKLDPVRLIAGVRGDLVDTRWLSRWGGFRYTHPSGCLALGAAARFDSDRRLPDIRVDFELLP